MKTRNITKGVLNVCLTCSSLLLGMQYSYSQATKNLEAGPKVKNGEIISSLPKEHNIALASEGGFVTVSSLSTFGRNSPLYGPGDDNVNAERINDGEWIENDKLESSHGKKWISDLDLNHPHWVWLRLAKQSLINRLVLHFSNSKNYPLKFLM